MSIRKFLLINLLLAIVLTTTLTAIGNYYLDEKDIRYHLDTMMVLSALSYQALLSDEMRPQDLSHIQNSLSKLPAELKTYYKGEQLNQLNERYLSKFAFQAWHENGKLLLRTPQSPAFPLSDHEQGFRNKVVNHQLWRIFATSTFDHKVRILVGERLDNRDQLINLIEQNDLYIMLLTFPLSGLLIWIIIGRGLKSVNRVAHEVANRASTYLEPVDTKGVPLEVKPLVEELNQLFLRLQQAFERDKRFAADAAHELRTPLAALKTHAEVALSAETADAREEALHKVLTGVDRSAHIVQQLLTLSRLVPEATHLDDTTEVNLGKLAIEVIAQVVPAAVVKNIEVGLNAPEKPVYILGNVTALSILIRNLVDNAIRYTPEGGDVVVEIEKNEPFVIFRVSDNGPGIPSELRARVFERFFRVLGNKSPGSGLGLAIVQQIAALHNAQVRLGNPKDHPGLEVEVRFSTLPATE